MTRLANLFQVKLTGAVSQSAAVNRVDMLLERCNAPSGLTPSQVDLVGFATEATGVPSWRCVELRRPTPKAVPLSRLKEWTSEFNPPPGTGALRVRIREVEFIPNGTPQEGTHLQSGTPDEIKERTVFTDTVSLPGLW
ncbi:hypothetical protein ACFQ61_34720 [Streptomyces sp. NPDC056500]|uniref:hypothetical protein n=1 Tax=Streptomyces sp. NPDC056500 TaxID=3345840 RepID=UPI0036B2C9F0